MRYLLLIAALAASSLPAQQRLEFEVASVRPLAPSSSITMIGGGPEGASVRFTAMSLADLISWAYHVKPWQMGGGPAWAGTGRDHDALDPATRRFDVVAKAEGEMPRRMEEYRQMMRSLLSDRFHLTTHREMHELPVYALVPDRSGKKMRESAEGQSIWRTSSGRITASGVTMTQLADWFSNANGVDRPVVDRTGIAGRYDFTLEFSDQVAAGTDADGAPDVFTAIREQLGLRLESGRDGIEFLVIDHAEIPGEN